MNNCVQGYELPVSIRRQGDSYPVHSNVRIRVRAVAKSLSNEVCRPKMNQIRSISPNVILSVQPSHLVSASCPIEGQSDIGVSHADIQVLTSPRLEGVLKLYTSLVVGTENQTCTFQEKQIASRNEDFKISSPNLRPSRNRHLQNNNRPALDGVIASTNRPV